MPTVIHDKLLEERLQAERTATGANRYDEVWEGVYIMAPMPNNEHQFLAGRFTRILDELIADHGLGQVLPGANVSDRVENWETNYRVPDVAVFLKSSVAVNHGSFFYGGPDFAVEIISQGDQTREKIEFYGKSGAREVLIVDRYPWKLELYRRHSERLKFTAAVTPGDGQSIVSEVVGISLSLRPAGERPTIHISGPNRVWVI
jgi:Uma2 family endonuclease